MGCLHGGRNILEGGSSQRHMFSVFSLHLTLALGSSFLVPCGGGGELLTFTPLYKPNRYVLSQRVGSLRRFGLKTGIDFAHFGVESGMVYEGTMVANKGVRRFNSN